jgi:hypothetical protein
MATSASAITSWDASGKPIQSANPAPVTAWDVQGQPVRNEVPTLNKDEAQRASDALIYSNLTNQPPSFTYENRDLLNKDFGERLGAYAEAGWKGLTQDSIIGEYLRGQISGPLGDEDEVSKFIEGFGQMIGDLPEYLIGGGLGLLAGGAACSVELPVVGTIGLGAVGAGAGGFALTGGLRQWLIDKYKGNDISAWDEVMDVLKATGKNALTGVAFGVAGEAAPLAGGVVGKYLGPRAYKVAAELAAMTTVGSLVEGQVPSAGDFARNAALVALMHVTIGNLPFAKKAAPELREKAMDLYAREGVHPSDVSSEASKRTVDARPTDNPMEILNKIDNELAGIAGKTPEAIAESVPKAETPAPQGESQTSIKNETTEAERAERGLPEVEVEARQVPAFEAGKKAVDEGRIDPRALAKELANDPRPHTDEEAAALLYDRMRLQNEHAVAMNTIEAARAAGDEAAEVRGKEHLRRVEDAINNNDEAARRSGTETGRALNARRMMIKQDYSLANVLQRARAASPNGEVTPEVRNTLEALTKQLDEANKRLDDYEESKKQTAAEQTVEKIKRQARASTRTATKVDLKTEYDSLLKDLNAELLGNLSANPMLNPKLYELFGKLAVNRIHSGLLTIEQIVDDLHQQLQERGISKREIRDYISQYGKKIELSKDQVKVQLREARAQGRLLSALEDAEAGERPEKSGLQRGPESQRVKELRQQVSDAMRAAGLKETPEQTPESRLNAYKKTLETKIKTLQKQLDTGDYTQPTRRQTVLDAQAEGLKAQAEKLKSQVDDAIYKQKLEARTPLEKGAAVFQKWRRAVLLSSVNTLGKLTTAAMLRFGTTPIEELVGGVLSHIPGVSDIAEKAPREGGGLNISAEAKAFGQFFEKATRDDIVEALRTGKTSLDYLYGKKSTLPPEALDFFGHLHGALKVLPKRAEFFRSLEKRAQWALDNHLDINDPKVQATMAADAYIDANRAIFMQENFINTGFRMLMNYFHSQGLSGKAAEFMIQTVLPIVKVPTNIVAETGTFTFGTVTGSIDALRVLVKTDGLKNLTGHEADNIMRSLKKGSIGLAVLAMGYYAGTSSGFIQSTGFYQPGDEKKEKKPETLTIGGVDLPPWLQHTPVGLVFEMGATMRRVNDAYTMKGKSGGFVGGATSAGLGAAKKIPFLEQSTRLAEATRTSDSAGLFLDDLIQSLIIPPDVRKLAEMTDDGTKRKPTDLKETIENAVPGLRENVPVGGQKREKKFSIRGAAR